MNNPSRKRKKEEITGKSKQEKRDEVFRIKKELKEYALSKWGKHWVNSILKYGRPYRMRRALSYAQEERISNLIISPGKIFATVQGTAPTPYRVNIHFDVIPDEEWKKILHVISKKSIYMIQLLENKLPDDFIQIFKESGHSLFPTQTKKLVASCSCPDKEIPCKHIACTILYIARVVDFNPFILLKLKGKDKDEFLKELKKIRLEETSTSISSQDIERNKELKKITNKKDFNVPFLPAHDLNNSKIGFQNGNPYKVGFAIKKPRKHLETIDTMGSPENLEKPDTFDLIYKNIYFKTIKKTFKMAQKLEK